MLARHIPQPSVNNDIAADIAPDDVTPHAQLRVTPALIDEQQPIPQENAALVLREQQVDGATLFEVDFHGLPFWQATEGGFLTFEVGNSVQVEEHGLTEAGGWPVHGRPVSRPVLAGLLPVSIGVQIFHHFLA